jgi:hypothetical protein
VRERVEAEIEKEMSRATRPFDVHPAPKERIALLERLAANERGAANDRPAGNAESAWALIGDPAGLQAEMMGVVREGLDRGPVGAPNKAEKRQPAGAPGKTQERPPSEERMPWHHRRRVRFYTGLLTLLGATVLGASYLPSKHLSRLLWANALALVSISTSFGPALRARFSRKAQT